MYDKSTSAHPSPCFLYLRTFLPVLTNTMLVTKALRQDVAYLAFVLSKRALALFLQESIKILMTVQLKRLTPSKLRSSSYDKSTSTPSSSCRSEEHTSE